LISIINARSASPLAPDLVAAISDEGLWNLASLPLPMQSKVHNAVQYFCIVSPTGKGSGQENGCLKDCCCYETMEEGQ